MSQLTVGFLLFPGFEVLDVYGPLEMFACKPARAHFDVVLVAERAGEVASAQKAVTVAEHDFASCPPLDILLVPGGTGTRAEINNAALVAWVRDVPATHKLSVCTGAALLAVAGLLQGRRATTNKLSFDWVVSAAREKAAAGSASEQKPLIEWVRRARWINCGGGVWTAAGVSAGMDMALAFIASLLGREAAEGIARFAEYSGSWRDGDDDPWGRSAA